MKTAMTSAQGNWFLLTNHPEKLYPAEFLDERWNVGDTPKVTMADLDGSPGAARVGDPRTASSRTATIEATLSQTDLDSAC